jgi:hypothetical protein
MNNFGKNKVILIVIGLILAGGLIFGATKFFGKKEAIVTPQTSEENAVVPTVDASVQVSLEKVSGGHEVLLTIKGLPKGTQTLEYALSYDTKTQVGQGVIGPPVDVNGKSEYEKQFTLGTCSSGKCVYHDVVGPIKLELKFNGDYGSKIFDKDFQI